MSYEVLVKSRYKNPTSKHIVKVAKDHFESRKAEPGIVEVELVNKSKIKEINNKFRKKDYPTDVLSFPTAQFPSEQKLYGTILLCCDIIDLNAKESGKSFESEFDFILRHGIDHLLGIHHK